KRRSKIMKNEIASWIPENLLHYLESDAERKNMTLKEAVVQALRLWLRPLSEGQSTGCGSENDYDRSRSGSFLLGCGFSVLACALASASLRRMELSRFWINRCFVSAIKRRHSGSGIASSFRMVLSTISLVCRSRITGTISFSPARVSSFVPAAY